MGGVEVEVALLPPHHRGIQGRQERCPRLERCGVRDVAGQHPAGRAVVEGDLLGLEIRQRAAHRRLGGAQPPLDVGGGAGTERRQPPAYELGIARGLVEWVRHVAEPVLGPRPRGLVDAPVAGVACAQDRPLQSQVRQHPGGDRRRPVIGLVGGAADHPGQLGHGGPQLGGGRRPVGQPGERGLPGGVEPGVPVGGDARFGDQLGDARALAGRHPGRGAAPGGGQQVAGEDEQRPAHGELLDDRSVVVQRGVDVRGRQPLRPLGDCEVHRRGLGGVQDRHRLGHPRDVVQPVGGRQRLAYADPPASLVVGDARKCHRWAWVAAQSRWDLPGRSSIRWSATRASFSVSGSTVIWLTTLPATRFSSAHTKWGRSMRFIVEQ